MSRLSIVMRVFSLTIYRDKVLTPFLGQNILFDPVMNGQIILAKWIREWFWFHRDIRLYSSISACMSVNYNTDTEF